MFEQKNNIVLIGFMGSGKTTVGKMLSEKLGYKFIDTDEEIEKRCGLSVSEIFEQKGEKFFRDMEQQIVDIISSYSKTVIACGGGIVKKEENIKKLENKGLIVCLSADNETIYNRIAFGSERPLVLGKTKQEIFELINDRKKLYAEADVFVDTTVDSILDIVNKIATIFKMYNND